MRAFRSHQWLLSGNCFDILTSCLWHAGMDVEQRKHLCSPQGIEPCNFSSSGKKIEIQKLGNVISCILLFRKVFLIPLSKFACHSQKQNVQCMVQMFIRSLFCCLIFFITFNLQALVAQNDGLMDGPGHNTAEAQVMASCYHLLFNCLQSLFAWLVSPKIKIVQLTEENLNVIINGLCVCKCWEFVDMSIKSIYLILMQCLPGNKQVLGL